jgi:hypothetical protein
MSIKIELTLVSFFLLYLLNVGNAAFAESKDLSKGLLLEGTMGEYRLLLVNDKPQCQLELQVLSFLKNKSTDLIPLRIKSPCYFFTDSKQKQAQRYSYPDLDVDYMMLIGGTVVELTAEERQEKKLPPSSYCTQQIQAVTLEKANIRLGSVNNNAFACAEERLDEIFYQQNLKQPRNDIETIIKQSQQKTAEKNDLETAKTETSFIESLQQNIEAIFKSF